MARKDTKLRLLDVAEEMFAGKGYANTSMRSLTGKAGANLAAVNYHFGSKEGLMRAVLERRLLPLNNQRQQRLEEVMSKARQNGQPPAARDLLRAYIDPTMALRRSGRGARAFIVIISRALGDPDATVRASFVALITPQIDYLRDCLAQALPHLSPQEIFWRVHFALGAMTNILHGLDRHDMFPKSMMPDPLASLEEMLLNFLASGMEAGA